MTQIKYRLCTFLAQLPPAGLWSALQGTWLFINNKVSWGSNTFKCWRADHSPAGGSCATWEEPEFIINKESVGAAKIFTLNSHVNSEVGHHWSLTANVVSHDIPIGHWGGNSSEFATGSSASTFKILSILSLRLTPCSVVGIIVGKSDTSVNTPCIITVGGDVFYVTSAEEL